MISPNWLRWRGASRRDAAIDLQRFVLRYLIYLIYKSEGSTDDEARSSSTQCKKSMSHSAIRRLNVCFMLPELDLSIYIPLTARGQAVRALYMAVRSS